jgi:hypothetical protein
LSFLNAADIILKVYGNLCCQFDILCPKYLVDENFIDNILKTRQLLLVFLHELEHFEQTGAHMLAVLKLSFVPLEFQKVLVTK